MPNKENIRVWVDALRSGRYQQSQASLRSLDGFGFCCLGVACDLYDPLAWEVDTPAPGFSFLKHTGYLPDEVADWLGLTRGGMVNVRLADDEMYDVADLNDSDGYTFAAIADELERTYL